MHDARTDTNGKRGKENEQCLTSLLELIRADKARLSRTSAASLSRSIRTRTW